MAFRNPIVAGEELVIPGIRSDNYVESSAGWRIGRDGQAQFAGLQSLGDLGVNGQVSANSFVVGAGGLWLPDNTELTERFQRTEWEPNVSGQHPNGPQGPKGLVAYYADLNITGTFGATETGVIATRFHEQFNRSYKIVANIRIVPSVTTDVWVLRFHYTRDNTIPTTASGTLREMALSQAPVANASSTRSTVFIHSSGNNDDLMWVGMFLFRYAGTGTATVITSSVNYCDIAVEDIGPRPGFGEALNRGGIGDAWNYGSSYSAPISPSGTTQQYTKTYTSQWSRTYNGDGTTTFDDTAYAYQGYYSNTRGNTSSLIGFDWATISSDLTGATNITMKFTFTPIHAYYNAGLTAVIGGHSYFVKPTTISGGTAPNQVTRANCVAGSTYTVTLPAIFATNFASGAWKGIMFGPGPTTSPTYYGYMYGATGPYLTVTYTK